jgi:DNA-binding transcriptional regulator YhcF (GntR family)
MSIRPRVDAESPVPLYHQLAESIRYGIATGSLKPGSLLPPLRTAAGEWKVNLHTVRRAYAELQRSGIVETRVPEGTRVKTAPPAKLVRSDPAARRRFVSAVVDEARSRHGMSVEDLIGELDRSRPRGARRTISVVECSRTQCDDLAAQISESWRVHAEPHPLQKSAAPPHGLIVATYFHYNDVRQRWPERLADVRFLAIAPEPDLARRMKRGSGSSRRRRVILCEKDLPMARNIAADLGRILPAKDFHLETDVVLRAEACLKRRHADDTILLSPRMWGEAPARLRDDPRVHQVRYVFDAEELEALAAEQGWESK